ncbi:MAG: lamin tail domain-containing protein [Ilumatobacteraceae bacterium]
MQPSPPARLLQLGLAAVLAVLVGACADSTSTTEPPTTDEPTDPATSQPAGAATDGVTLVEVVDGDTIVVLVDGTEERVRIVGINTPESGECLADAAGDRLGDLLASGTITLTADQSDRDQYGRLLRYVEVDGDDVGERLVAEGLAISRRYEPDTARAANYDGAQASAEEQHLGQWAADACGPATNASLAIVEINADAPGDDGQNLNGEWVVIRNDGGVALDLTGWGIKDESASNRYEFPDGFVLPVDATVTVLSGCGDDDVATVHWCASGSAIWTNAGDTVFVLDPAGNVVVSRSY